jgi:hypothetical protein
VTLHIEVIDQVGRCGFESEVELRPAFPRNAVRALRPEDCQRYTIS